MDIDIFTDADWLRIQNNNGYHALPIPNHRDDEISELLRLWLELDKASLVEVGGKVAPEKVRTLRVYSYRMACLAVREQKEEWILLGLAALSVGSEHKDWRDDLILVSLFYDATQRLGLSDNTFE